MDAGIKKIKAREATARWRATHKQPNRVLKYDSIPPECSVEMLSFCAGIFDAEGTFVIGGDRENPRPVVSLYNNDKTLLKAVQAVLGGALRRVKRVARSDKHEESYILDFSNRALIITVCNRLVPYLVLKKLQCLCIKKACQVSQINAQGSREEVLEKQKNARRIRVHLREAVRRMNAKAQIVEAVKIESRQVDLIQVPSLAWAYLAGYIDGDGVLAFQTQHHSGRKYVYYYPWVLVFSTKLEALTYLNNIFGGTLKFRSRREGWAMEGALRFENQSYVEKIVAGIYPFLISEKNRNKAQIILDSMQVDATERIAFVEKLQKWNKA